MYRFTTAFLKTLGAIFELPQLYFPSVYFLQHNQDGYLPIDCTSFHLDVGCCVEEESIRFSF